MSKLNPSHPLHQTTFLTSAAKLSQCPPDIGAEVTFCGRSNAGKSSSINYLTDQRKLARTSKTPGRTQLINFFSVSDSIRIVDLPGYGYAKVPSAIKRDWHKNIDDYLKHRQCLRGLILVMDIRHPLKEFDLMMLDWCEQARLPLHILLTKADKLKRGARQATLFNVKKSIPQQATVQTFSATNNIGKEQLSQLILDWTS